MMRHLIGFSFAAAVVALSGSTETAVGQEKRTGSVVGEIKSRKDTPNGKNVMIEVLAAGEEKARSYRVQYDPSAKGPIPEVLKVVRGAGVGDRVEFDWIDTGEGLAIKKFAVLKKAVAPSLEDSLAWIKRVDGELKKPRYADLTADKLKAQTELQLGGHRKSDNKHLFVKAEEFRHLTPLTGLKKLHLGENDGATDEALAHVGKLTGLTELVLWDAPITDAGLKHLTGLKELTALDLAFATKITTAGLEHVAKLPKLEKLNLAGTKVDNVSALAGLTGLKELRLGKLTPAGVDDLKKANPALAIK